MTKYLAVLILIGLASMLLCGLFLIGPATHSMNHAGSDALPLEHHFSMWNDISTALISNVATSIAALISILALAYFVVRNFAQSLLNTQLVYDHIPIEPDRGSNKQTKLTRWLALFENSPSFA